MMRRAVVLAALAACGDNASSQGPIAFGTMGPLTGDAGRGTFRFGAATAATQIEDDNTHTDWYVWTQPAPDGLGHGTFVGDAVKGYTKDLDDLQLVKTLGLDSYRFSIEWARIEPVKDQIDEAAIQHYRDELMALEAMGIRPLVTIHHFSNPVWVADPRATDCPSGPSETNLCGLGHPTGGPMIVDQMAEHAALLAQRLGDLVDEWGTVNEPINYLVAGYVIGEFPPGKISLTDLTTFVPVLRDYLSAHAKMYDAIKANDTVDADGDGVAAVVGLSLSVADWEPARNSTPSKNPDDLAARDRLIYLFHWAWVDSLLDGTFDSDLDGTPDEQHPEWAGRLDWLGVQYYMRAGVTAMPAVFPDPVALTPCLGQTASLGACLPAADPTFCVAQMGYEFWPDGLRQILIDYGARYPQLPLVVTESGIATDVGARRAEAIVRILEAIARARDENHVDVRGYYHWSLTDNFEWAMGFGPHFGLYSVDRSTFARTPTEGADVLGAIVQARTLTAEQRKQYGGVGPMTPDAQATDSYCQPL